MGAGSSNIYIIMSSWNIKFILVEAAGDYLLAYVLSA